MKQYVLMILLSVLVTSLGCGSKTHDLEVRQLSEKVKTMQYQMISYDKRVEDLSNLLTVLRALHSQEMRGARSDPGSSESQRGATSAVEVPRDLRVVRLVPNESNVVPVIGKGKLAVGGGTSPRQSLRVVTAKVPPPPRVNSIDDDAAELLFTDGLGAYQKGEFKNAIRYFAEFSKMYQSHARVGDSLYWLASCQFELKLYGEAIRYYKKYLKRYPIGKKVPEVLLHMGLAYEKIHALNEAELVFERLVQDFPVSAITEIARSHLGDSKGEKR